MTISFEKLGAESAEMLSEIHRQSFPSNSWSHDEFNMLLLSPGVHAMVISGAKQPLGFLLWRQVVDEAEIITFCILPAYQKQGLAGQLLHRFFDETKGSGVSYLFLEVNENNRPAINLYEKHGFESIGRRKEYYANTGRKKEDALVMKYIG